MRRVLPVLCLAVLLATPGAPGRDITGSPEEAMRLAESLMEEVGRMFRERNARGLSEGYAERGKLYRLTINPASGRMQEDVRTGRTEVFKVYQDFFNLGPEPISLGHKVEYARLEGPDLLVFAGTLDIRRGDDARHAAFVQLRVKHDDRWLIQTQQLISDPRP
jgi:hypothetical protein